jgi:hypothetical protein
MSKLGLKFDVTKTDTLGITKIKDPIVLKIKLKGQKLKQSKLFRCLWCFENEEGKCEFNGKTNFRKINDRYSNKPKA